MTLTKEEIKFDPGFIQHLQAFVPTVEEIYSNISKFKNLSQKRNMFKMYYLKLQNILDSYIGFYLGCMLWAVVIVREKGQPVIGNLCWGGTFDEDTLYEVNFVMDFTKQFERDAKYYLNENCKVENFESDILEKYKEFLTINKGFINCKMTDDIKIPKSLKEPSAKEIGEIVEKIKEVTQTGNFTDLYEIKDLILK